MDAKQWKKSKTILVGAALVAAGGALTSITEYFSANPIPDPWNGVVISVIGAAMIYLRTVTNTPIGK